MFLLSFYEHFDSCHIIHRLDASSPLLTKSARKKVLKNGGHWPDALKSNEDIGNSIHFDNLLVSFKGKSKIAGTPVYHQELYTMDDIKIGVEFQSCLIQNPDGSIFVQLKDIDMVQKERTSWGQSFLRKNSQVERS